MTQKFALVIEYNGKNYAGFQIQNNIPTIQSEIERALELILKEKIRIQFAGRTDCGVHASGQVVSFPSLKSPEELNAKELAHSLNGVLPRDISVRCASTVQSSFHPRYSCIARKYEYLIWNHSLRSAHWDQRALWYRPKLSIKKLNQEVQAIIGTHDFSSFTPARYGKNGSNIRMIRQIHSAFFISNQSCNSGSLIRFRICGNSFLHHMIRILIGTLLDWSSGHLIQGLRDVLKSHSREAAGKTAPPEGLYFHKAYYPSGCEFDSSVRCLAVWDGDEMQEKNARTQGPPVFEFLRNDRKTDSEIFEKHQIQ